MSAFLPRFDPNPEQREHDLELNRSKYQFSYTHVSPLALVDKVPFEDAFCVKWLQSVTSTVVTTLKNRSQLEQHELWAEKFVTKAQWAEQYLSAMPTPLFHLLHDLVAEMLLFKARESAPKNWATSMEEFAAMFRAVGLPPVSASIGDDFHFAEMRVAGPNPVMLQQIRKLDDRLPFNEADYAQIMPGDSLAAAGAEGRLFLADYQKLSHIEGSTEMLGRQKYLYAPLALFAIDRTTRKLRPIAIQCGQTPGPDNPVFTPHDGYNWLIAKTIVETADGNFHEAITHLGRTHLLAEPVAVCTLRQLAPSHPIFVLLYPHFEGTMRINSMAWQHLVDSKGVVARLMGGTIEQSLGLAADGLKTYHIRNSTLPRSLSARGVDDTTWLCNYPYRDDALLYWNAISKWVLDYLRLYYPSDEEVGRDIELIAWINEIGSDTGGRIVGFEEAPSPTIAGLAEVLTMVIYTCSVQHAAVNFPQYLLMSYAPHMPLAVYAPAPKTKNGATEQDYLKMLPPLDLAELQMDFGYILGSIQYTTLGQYGADYFNDPLVAEPLQQFQARLDEIGKMIEERNKSRTPYQFLNRSGIPQSINI
jgi:arachidonate 15-lipoxygenase